MVCSGMNEEQKCEICRKYCLVCESVDGVLAWGPKTVRHATDGAGVPIYFQPLSTPMNGVYLTGKCLPPLFFGFTFSSTCGDNPGRHVVEVAFFPCRSPFTGLLPRRD